MKARKVWAVLLTAVLTAGLLAGCGGSGKDQADAGSADNAKEEESVADGGSAEELKIELPTYRAGTNSGAKFFLAQVDRFNEKYDGTYEIEVTYSGGAEEHNEKVKQLGLQGALPVVFQFSDFSYAEDNFFKEGVLHDMSGWLESNEEFRSVFLPDGLEYVTQEDGAVYALPLAVIRPTGMYYNAQGFTPSKAIRDMTWQELIDEMKAQGAVYAFQTAEQGWTLNLTTVAIMGTLEGGAEILNGGLTERITDFSAPQWKETFEIMKDLYDAAGWTDGLGKTYPDTENAFVNNIVSVLPNGQWVIANLSTDSTNWGENYDGEQVHGDFFPGNIANANPCTYDWYVSGTASEEELELAKAFLEFINTQEELEAYAVDGGGVVPMLTPTENYKEQMAANRVMSEFSSSLNEETVYVPCLHEVVPDIVMDTFGATLPAFLQGSMTVEEFCQALTTAATE